LHVITRHDSSFALRIGLGQALSQEEQQRYIQENERCIAKKDKNIDVLGYNLPRERDSLFVVNDDLEKELMHARADDGFIAKQHGPEL
jgi:hypothetical protein